MATPRIVTREPAVPGRLNVIVPVGMGKVEVRSKTGRHADDLASSLVQRDKLAFWKEPDMVNNVSFGE